MHPPCMGDSAFEPVGQHYNAVSPDESLTSAHELTDARFRRLFDVEAVSSLGALFFSTGNSNTSVVVAPPVPDGWTKRVRDALLDTASSEEHMNAILQQALTEADGVQGLGVEKTGKTKTHNETETALLKVKERCIRNLFIDCYRDDSYKNLERKNGLPITLMSKPDFAVWTADGGGMLITCAGKNKEKYRLFNAVRQCAAYMLVHLFYWLVTKSKAAQSVYGVAVAGTNCKDMKTGARFAVVLLSLSLPTKVGGKLRIKKYEIPHHSLDQLWTIVNRVCKTKLHKKSALTFGQGCPALLQMPSRLLETEPNDWLMVKNGTANLVLRIDGEQGWITIGRYLEGIAFKLFQKRLGELGQEGQYPMYFKSKNYVATDEPCDSAFYFSVDLDSPSLSDIRDAYAAMAFRTSSGLYILMSDMGVPFRSSNFPKDLRSLAAKFLPFMDRVLDCQKESELVHGDIHLGNLLYDKSEKLRLIDYDEARYDELTVRKPHTEKQRRVYNELLADDFVEFTKNQLTCLFQECWRSLGTSGDASLANIRVSVVMGQYDLAFEEGQSPDTQSLEFVYDQLYDVLQQIANGTISATS